MTSAEQVVHDFRHTPRADGHSEPTRQALRDALQSVDLLDTLAGLSVWYNRAVVERVMGFCTTSEYQEFMEQVPGLEQALVDSGIHLIKLWFSVSRAEQRTRFTIRVIDPLRQWKLSPVDLAALNRWDDYTRAKEAMFQRTDIPDARQDAHHPNLEVLLLGGQPIREPVVHYGPFVMNTRQEIAQAIADYQAGRLGQIPAQPIPHRHPDDVELPYLDAGPGRPSQS